MISFHVALLSLYLALSNAVGNTAFTDQTEKAMEQATQSNRPTLMEQAKNACATAANKGSDFWNCVEDVLATGDIRLAAVWSMPGWQGPEQSDNGNPELLQAAKEACADDVEPLNYDLCIEDVMDAGDLGIVRMFRKIPGQEEATSKRSQRQLRGSDRPQNEKFLAQAKQACRFVKEVDRELCVEDVLFTRDLGAADLWPKEIRRRLLVSEN